MIRNTTTTILLAAAITAAALSTGNVCPRRDEIRRQLERRRLHKKRAVRRVLSVRRPNRQRRDRLWRRRHRPRWPGPAERRGFSAGLERLGFCGGVRASDCDARLRQLVRSSLRRPLLGQLGGDAGLLRVTRPSSLRGAIATKQSSLPPRVWIASLRSQ